MSHASHGYYGPFTFPIRFRPWSIRRLEADWISSLAEAEILG